MSKFTPSQHFPVRWIIWFHFLFWFLFPQICTTLKLLLSLSLKWMSVNECVTAFSRECVFVWKDKFHICIQSSDLFVLTYLRMISPTLLSSDQSVRSSSRSLWWSGNKLFIRHRKKHVDKLLHQTYNITIIWLNLVLTDSVEDTLPLFWCEPRRCLGCSQILS